jgi:DNA-binding NarL/FixJ family response regulator
VNRQRTGYRIRRGPAITPTAIWAVEAGTRDGIASLLEDAPEMEVVGAAEDEGALVHLLEPARVGGLVMVAGPDSTPAVAQGLAEEAAVIALGSDAAWASVALRAGVRAILLSAAGGEEVVAAIWAVA